MICITDRMEVVWILYHHVMLGVYDCETFWGGISGQLATGAVSPLHCTMDGFSSSIKMDRTV